MKQVLIKHGQVNIAQVPAPLVTKGHILVEVAYSLISTGTEVSHVEASRKSLVKRAIEKPQQVEKIIQNLRQQGIQKTVEKIKGKLDEAVPLGYSCVGRVIQSADDAGLFHAGDWVACAGAGLANHAEIVLVPQNLTVKVPEGCDLRAAASVTLGAIALQGVRRADPRLGEIVSVIGLGLLGQITVQLLKAAGCRVIGIDLDPHRVEMACRSGADLGIVVGQVEAANEVSQFTSNYGVDATIITAASESDAIVQQAMEITRRKGRVVVVGAVGLGLKRSPFYEKEIDFLISCSYGPGRYDSVYEKEGLDYPYAYVRWTENRNMQEYLRLIQQGLVKMDQVIESEYELDRAAEAYASLTNSSKKPLAVLLSYPVSNEDSLSRKIETITPIKSHHEKDGKIGVALIGAGNFAKGMHLPNLQKLDHTYRIRAIVDTNGVNARNTAEQFGADLASTNYEEILSDDSVSLVMICTRHKSHARLALKALEAGKHVFVEKPLALTEEELNEIESFYSQNAGRPLPVLLTGFNRRFSPYLRKIHSYTRERQDPMIMNYRMNAGYIPLDHWVHGPEGGGRNRGEACHIYDLFTFLTESRVVSVCAGSIRPKTGHYSSSDNFTASIQFEDGSLATLTYTALGASSFPKEQAEVYVDGKILALDDYQKLSIFGAKWKGLESRTPDKGHLAELQCLAEALRGETEWPIPLWQQVQATKIALMIEQSLQ